MYIFPEKLKAFMKQRGWSVEQLAAELDIEVSEVEKMLNGEIIGIEPSRRFIMYFKIPLVLSYIDFEKTGVDNPFAK